MKDESVEGAIRRILAGRRGGSPGPCPDANVLAAFLEARLAPEEAGRFEAHAADCSACRQVLALAIDLAPPEGEHAARKVPEVTGSPYRTSPVRLALGAAFALVAGVLLFQAVRDSRMQLPDYQVARQEQGRSVTEGKELPAAALGGSAGAGQVRPSVSAGPADAAGRAPAGTETRTRTASAEPATAARPDEQPSLRPAPTARPETAKPQAAEAVAELMRENKAKPEAEALKDRLALQADEPAGKGTKPAEPAPPPRKETALGQTVDGVNAVQNANVQRQAANTQLQAANVLYQNANVTAQNANVGAQTAGDVSQLAKAPAQAVDQQAGAAGAQARRSGMASELAKAKSVNPVQQAIADARSGKQQRLAYIMADQTRSQANRKVGTRIFYRTRDFWVDGSCLDHADAPVCEIARDSTDYREMVKKEPALGDLPADVPVVLFWNGSNCLIR